MNRYFILSAIFVISFIQTIFSETDQRMSDQSLHESTNGFALELYNKLTEESDNVFFSPISISFALAMTSLGARENTLNEMMATLKMDSYEKNLVHTLFKNLGKSLLAEESQNDYTLSLANRLFGEKSYTFHDNFLQETLEYYNAKLEPLDFKIKFEESRKHINDWVSNVTNDKIKDILAPGILSSLTRLVLVNAIYFKGDWLAKFSAQKTRESDFYVSETEVLSVPLMHDKLNVSYGYDNVLKSEVLELPYKGESLSMVVILPNLEETSLEQVERALTPAVLSNFHLRKSEVKVWLPKFKLESSFNLNEKLMQLGMRDIFEAGKADLSGIDGSRNLFVSSVVHKAFVDVNEEGSEAAAATAVVVTMRSSPITPQFKADHPFIFFIWDKNSILFLGRFIRP